MFTPQAVTPRGIISTSRQVAQRYFRFGRCSDTLIRASSRGRTALPSSHLLSCKFYHLVITTHTDVLSAQPTRTQVGIPAHYCDCICQLAHCQIQRHVRRDADECEQQLPRESTALPGGILEIPPSSCTAQRSHPSNRDVADPCQVLLRERPSPANLCLGPAPNIHS